MQTGGAYGRTRKYVRRDLCNIDGVSEARNRSFRGKNMITLFSNSRELENQTDEFCDKLSEGVLAFQIGINAYFSGDTEAFAEKMGHVSEVESRGDELRREIQRRLYAETLLPESRGDVLHLLEDSDQILNACESSMWQFFIEKPEFDAQIGKEFCKNCHMLLSQALRI